MRKCVTELDDDPLLIQNTFARFYKDDATAFCLPTNQQTNNFVCSSACHTERMEDFHDTGCNGGQTIVDESRKVTLGLLIIQI